MPNSTSSAQRRQCRGIDHETDPESSLFQPIFVGDMELSHRVVMASLTRLRTNNEQVPLPIVAEYYGQRASVPGTLIVSEATSISQNVGVSHYAPGIWTSEQIGAWRQVTQVVHARKSFFFLQLYANGAGATALSLDNGSHNPTFRPPTAISSPWALTTSVIHEYTRMYVKAAENAIQGAGSDGVEIHGAAGSLIHQFLHGEAPQVSGYYGRIENRTRFALEVLDAIVQKFGARKTALKLSPWSSFPSDQVPTYTYLVEEIRRRHPDLAYLHVEERILNIPRADNSAWLNQSFARGGDENDFIRRIWSCEGKRLIVSGGYTRETAMRTADYKGDIVSFGRLFISNPDLPYRLRKELELNQGNPNLYYANGSMDPSGYTDYPFSGNFLRDISRGCPCSRNRL